MTAGETMLTYRRLRAPREDRAVLVDPPESQLATLVAENARRLQASNCEVHGRSLAELSATTRRELIGAAHRYTTTYRDVACPSDSHRIIIAGHQPELFHPGVWFKNFVLGRTAQSAGAVAVNLVIDSDTVKQASIRVPAGAVDAPRIETVPFDGPSPQIPFEERTIVDAATLESFAERAGRLIAPLAPNAMLASFWPTVVERARATGNLGQAISQARHGVEGTWGLQTLELPQSQICQLRGFHWFTAHLLADLPRFWTAYNEGVAEYRRANHVRSANHPVPDLARDGDWLEAPLWVWTAAAPRRRRLFVRRTAEGVEIADRDRQFRLYLPLSAGRDASAAADVLSGLGVRGVKLRSRALITTLFARLVLGDLFLHGIGGAKYDQLTDVLIQRFFGLEPPTFGVVSATLHLPITRPHVSTDDVRAVEAQLRELAYHPEGFLDLAALPADSANAATGWIELKRHWLGVEQTVHNARQRCRELRGANEALQAWVEPRRRELSALRDRLRDAERANAVLGSREFSFCLFPESTLRGFFS